MDDVVGVKGCLAVPTPTTHYPLSTTPFPLAEVTSDATHVFHAMNVLWVALGGAIGSTLRYVLDGAVYRVLPPTFPFGTFVVNITGCLLFGLLFGAAEGRLAVGTIARSFLLIGVLGGFTTFSSFSFETLQLLRDGEWLRGSLNIAGQVAGGLIAIWTGLVVTRVVAP